ncbi:PAS domain-containing protein, partial [Escherichia coli]|nr:PAS domain-containing protein [Escherichia coli]
EVAGVGAWRVDPATATVSLDERMRAIWGFPAESAALPLPALLDRVHPNDRDAVAAALAAALDPAGDGGYAIEFRILLPDGG